MNQDLYDEHTIQEVFKYVNEGQKIISKANNKDLILFIGRTHVGKSTTINSLLGVHFKESEERLSPDPPESIIAPIGSKQKGSISCTKYPKIYFSQNSDKCYLDTQGFFDNRNNKVINIASTILMQMAIKQAKSVRAVVLSSYNDIENGFATFHPIGLELSSFIKSDDAPVFFLINRFYQSRELIKQGFIEWPEEKQNSKIKTKIEESFEYIIKGGEKLKIKLMKRLVKKARDLGLITKEKSPNDDIEVHEFDSLTENSEILSILEQDPEFRNANDKYLYVSLLKNNFEKGHYGYIDPLSQVSIQQFLNDISKLPELDTDFLVFNGESNDRAFFDDVFRIKINKDIDLMKKFLFCKTYPEINVDRLIDQLQQNVLIKQKLMEQLTNNSIDKENLQNLFKEFTSETQNNIDNLQRTLEDLKQKQIKDEEKLKMFLQQDPFNVFTDIFNEKVGFAWYTNHYTNYNRKIPFCKYTEELDKHTKRYSVIDTKSPNFKVIYTTGTKAHDVLPCIPIINLISMPIFCLTSKNCKGVVKIYAKPEDAEPEKYNELKDAICQDKAQTIIVKEKITTLQKEGECGLKNQLSNLIEILTQNIRQLTTIKNKIHETIEIWYAQVVKDDNKSSIENGDEEIKKHSTSIVSDSISIDNDSISIDNDSISIDNDSISIEYHEEDIKNDEKPVNNDNGFDDIQAATIKKNKLKIYNMTRYEEIESHKGIIDLLYKDNLRNPTIFDFNYLFNKINSPNQEQADIKVDSMITTGNLIFHLDQS